MSASISTPSRPRPSPAPPHSASASSSPAPPQPAASAPRDGYSYLARSTSISTPTRSRPKGLTASPRLSLTDINTATEEPRTTTTTIARSKTMHALRPSPSLPLIPPAHDDPARIADAVAKLPTNPKQWTPSQVALYLTHVLGLVPRPVVEDVTAYVRSSRMGGRAFLRLSQKDLELQGLNTKWRRLMIEAVRKLRRDALRGRIWGNDSGSVKWPRSHDYDDDEDLQSSTTASDDHDDSANDTTTDGIVRGSKGVSKLTLKRMREQRKVQGIIKAFQLSPTQEKVGLSQNDLTALGIDQIRKGHVASRGGSNGSDDAATNSPRPHIPPVFGEGYVRDQAESYESSSEADGHHLAAAAAARRSRRARAEDGKGDIFDDLLASVSDAEAAELASELDDDDLQDPDRKPPSRRGDASKEEEAGDCSFDVEDEVALVPRLGRHPPGAAKARDGSDGSATDSHSLYSGTSDSELDMDELLRQQDQQGGEARFGLLDADVINAIMGDADDDVVAADPAVNSGLVRSRTTGSLASAPARPERPYRASLYTTEELLLLDAAPGSSHARTQSSAEVAGALGLETDADEHPFLASPGFDTAKKRPVVEAARVDDLFGQPAAVGSTPAEDEYVFDPPASMLAPAPAAPAPQRSQPASLRKKMSGTYGSKRGKALLSLLQTATDENDPALLDLGASSASNAGSVRLRKKRSVAGARAEDEEGWGGTLSRHTSRKSLSNVYLGGEEAATLASSSSSSSVAPRAAEGAGTLSATQSEAGMASRLGSVAVRRRPLERVASEAEAEAWHEALDEAARQQEQEVTKMDQPDVSVDADAAAASVPETEDEVLRPVERYEDTTPTTTASAETNDDGAAHPLSQKPSVERRLFDLFSRDGEAAPSPSVQDTTTAAVEQRSPIVHAQLGLDPRVDEDLASLSLADPVPHDEPPPPHDDDSIAVVEDSLPAPSVRGDEVALTASPSLDTPAVSCTADGEKDIGPATLNPSTTDKSTPPSAATDPPSLAASDDTFPRSESQLLVPLTTLEPHPSGTGSIRKRSMVLVDRKRFESLARKMALLEDQISLLEFSSSASTAAVPPPAAAAAGERGLKQLFAPPPPPPSSSSSYPTRADAAVTTMEEEEEEEGDTVLVHSRQASVVATPPVSVPTETKGEGEAENEQEGPQRRFSLLSPSTWTRYLSSLNPYYASTSPSSSSSTTSTQRNVEGERKGKEEGGEEEEEEADWKSLGAGAIPAYMLGLSAGVGFVVVKEVVAMGLVGRR